MIVPVLFARIIEFGLAQYHNRRALFWSIVCSVIATVTSRWYFKHQLEPSMAWLMVFIIATLIPMRIALMFSDEKYREIDQLLIVIYLCITLLVDWVKQNT